MIHDTQSAQISQKQDERNIYVCNHENNVPSRLSPQWLCGNSCTWAHDVRLPKCMSCHKAIVVITGRAHCFHDCIYIYILFALLVACVKEFS